ncbi:hypothetical protein [Rhodohalobacter sp. 614A]|uniref:hypothetical protein n=1 Tax=Rhodohalobacter sp. 614A TaxID=2908649 RepID=UPI001F207F76|nr:hypothetical protein [Rhodohalobacter sp. 614A]
MMNVEKSLRGSPDASGRPRQSPTGFFSGRLLRLAHNGKTTAGYGHNIHPLKL